MTDAHADHRRQPRAAARPWGMRWQLGLALSCITACSEPNKEASSGQARGALMAPLAEAICIAEVEGVGQIDTETDYLPHVIACENGGADIEALQVQAIAARSVLYWTQGTYGSICDGQGCQVYTCGNAPSAIHQQAVDATSGKYLAYNGNVTYGFYVNGDPNTAPPSCIGAPNAANENWITYNEGLTGTDVAQSPLGFQHAPTDSGYGQNRGCMGQWGARCLEGRGYDSDAIMRFYYGADIEVLKAEGPCVIPDAAGGSGGAGGGNVGNGGAATSAPSAGAGAEPPFGEDPVDETEASCACVTAKAPRDALPLAWLIGLLFAVVSRRRRQSIGFQSSLGIGPPLGCWLDKM